MWGPIIVFLVGSILSSSSGTDVPTKCLRDNGALKYAVGQSYSYNYGVHAYGQFDFDRRSGESNKPVVHINGSVILTPISDCEYILTLKNTIISSRPTSGDGQETETGKTELEQSSLKFIMNNAEIEDVFYGADDPSWLVNLKKTILFMIQNRGLAIIEKEKETEASVFGNCVTDYTTTDKSYVKLTHLKKCGQGEGSDLIFHGVPYHIPLVTNKPVFGFLRPDAHVRCTQTVENDILTDVICSEQSHGHPGMSLVSVLKFSEKSGSVNTEAELEKLVIPTPVLYNFTKSYSKLMEDNAVEKVRQLLLQSHKSDDSNKAEIYIELKKAAVRVSNLEQFTTSEFIGEEIHKDAFYDALAEVSTDEAIRVVANAANRRELDTTTLLNFYANIAFASAPGSKSLTSLAELVKNWSVTKPQQNEGQEVDPQAMTEFKGNLSLGQHLLLGASGLAHQYCKLTPNCAQCPEYQALVNNIAAHANMAKSEEDIVLGALQALGNLDALTPAAVEAVQTIFSDPSTPIWLEIQAMEAFRRDPCQSHLKETVRKILENPSKTTQVRIHAYLAVTKCITPDDMTSLFTLGSKDSPDVAAFIASHIRNIADSSSPSKDHLKKLELVPIPESTLSVHNRSRVSKYVEYSHFNPKDNLGFSGEMAVIFIPGQSQPEFVSFNVTVDIHGRSFNFLEVGLSQRTLVKTMMFEGDEVPENWGSLHQATTAKDSYYRVLGTTVALSLESLHNAIQTAITKSGVSPGAMIMDIIQPSTYLDEEITFPTISGLPLSLELQGVTFDSIKLEMLGETDFSSLFGFGAPASSDVEPSTKSNSADFDYKISINADSAATIKGAVSLGAHTPIHTGYQVEGKYDQKQNFGLAMSSKNGPKLDMDLKLNFPNQVISSRDLSVDVFGFEEIQGKFAKLRDNGKKDSLMVGESLRSQPQDCWNSAIGLQMCGSERNGNTFPKMFSYSLEKENPEMEGFDVKITSDGAEFTPTYEMTITTPGSKTNRLFKMAFKSEQGNYETPGSWESKEVTITTQLDSKKYTGRVFWNRTEVVQFPAMIPYDFDLGVDYSSSDTAPPTELFKLMTYQPKEGSFNVEAKFDGPLGFVGDFKGTYDREFVIDPEGYYRRYSSYKDNKHFEWTSDVFGKTFGDINYNYSENGTSFSAKLNQNNHIYGLEHNHKLYVVHGEPVKEDYGDDKYHSYTPTLERLDKFNTIVTYHPNKKYELDAGMGWKRLDGQGAHENNLTLDISTPHTKHPISAKLLMSQENYGDQFNGSLAIEAEGEKKVDISSKTNLTSGLHLVKGNIKEIGEFAGNLTGTGGHRHIHMDIKYTYHADLEIILDTDINDDGSELKQKTEVKVEDKKTKNILNSESHLVVDRSQRTLDYLSKTTQTLSGKKQELLSKVEMQAATPPDYWNGKSYANMRIEDHNGQVYSGSLNQTLASSEDKYLKSNLALDFHSPVEKVPFTFNWDLDIDTTLRQGDKYESEVHITSDKHFTGITPMSPFDLLIQKDIHIHKKKGVNVYEWISSSNITDKGKLARTTDVQLAITGHDDQWKSLTVAGTGFTQDANYRDTFSGQLDSEEHLINKQYSTKQMINFQVDRTDLKTQVTSNLIDGVMNKTSYFHDIMDFEVTENGHVRVEGKKSYNWIQLVRLHNQELTIFKEVEEVDGDNVHDTKFLFDISAKVLDENHQTKLIMKSRHSLRPDCPVANFNFTLSK